MEQDGGSDGSAVRERALQEMELLLEAAVALRQDLEGHEAVCRAIIDGVRSDEPLADVLEQAASRRWRPRLTDSLTVYERLRHQARLRLIALGAAEGMTVADVQYHWSITKQLANRALREIEQLD